MPFPLPEMFFLPYPSGKFMLMLLKLCLNAPSSRQKISVSVTVPIKPDNRDAFSRKVQKPQISRLKQWGALGLTDLRVRA